MPTETFGLIRHDMSPNGDVQGSPRAFSGTVTTARDANEIASNCDVNFFARTNRDTHNDFFNGLRYDLIADGSNNTGARQAVFGSFQMDQPTSTSNLNRNYVGVTGFGTAFSSDNGTGLAVTTAKGALFGMSAAAYMGAGATNWLNVSAIEADVFSYAGSSYAYASAASLISGLHHAAAIVDAACWIGAQGGAVGWRYGVLFTDRSGSDPVGSSTTLFGSEWAAGGPRQVANGVDLRGFTFSDAAFAAPNFKVDVNGNVQITGVSSQVELGSKTVAGNALVDFNSSGNGNDFDVRLIAGGGTTTSGRGHLTAIAESFYVGGHLTFQPSSNPTLVNAGDMTFEIADNTHLRLWLKGGDGVARSVTLALA
ncbi:hypothetical protein ASD38_09895 [Caulobacter sp. Root487D2Y]|uniref:hypothetical protein n=1 Tax=Caulobacter sp. Root487D2Y TaxID=1736547 RepID=UPI0006FBBCD6|nr:hypothetical protein [Caulobacter sp. Root487D2Y]KQY29638.1 hypothetical protein ASD38_09895 [Caulobacter sp. Root487D2Y]